MNSKRAAARPQKPAATATTRLRSGSVGYRNGLPPARLRCKATARTGQRCSRPRWRTGKFCYFHTGTNAAEMGAKGGRRRALFNPANLESLPTLKTADDVCTLLATTTAELRAGRLDPKVAAVLQSLGAGFLSALEVAKLEGRIRELEAKLGENRPGQRVQ